MAAIERHLDASIKRNRAIAQEALARAIEALENDDLRTAQAEAACAAACLSRARVSLGALHTVIMDETQAYLDAIGSNI